jgi:hypothetical protein
MVKRFLGIATALLVLFAVRLARQGRLAMGLVVLDRRSLAERQAAGKTVDMTVFGMVEIDSDVTPEQARETIRALRVFGLLQEPTAVLPALEGRVTVFGTIVTTEGGEVT